MKTTYKAILGSALAIAVIGGTYVNRPKIEVTAEATANATSTVIVPTSTVQTVTTSVAPETRQDAHSAVYIYKTYVESQKEEKPTTTDPMLVTAGSMIDTVSPVPTPVYSNITVNPTPVTVLPTPVVIQPAPVPEPVVEPVVVAPTFTEWPHAWVEERYNGDWLFFEGKWDTGELGTVKCNGIYYDKSVKSGFASILEAPFKDLPSGTYVTCDFTVGDMGGTTLNYVVK